MTIYEVKFVNLCQTPSGGVADMAEYVPRRYVHGEHKNVVSQRVETIQLFYIIIYNYLKSIIASVSLKNVHSSLDI